ncbi:MAG: hypothetical protein RIC04_13620 [Parvibaculum sp.]|uniref:hypothetical protein n=1 Tax=Parvibaculum sp. TaxID=2024848 RepID=UPI0032F010EC
MKTHEIAKLLMSLARALQSAPNQTLDDLASGGRKRRAPDPDEIPVALGTLVALSDVDKNQWYKLIQENNFPIEIRPRDASRDVLGKLLRFLEQNPEARKKLTKSRVERSSTSPELARALQFLLRS